MANYMTKVAKLLDLKIGKRFKCSNGCTYVLTKKGIRAIDDALYESSRECDYAHILLDILTGELTVSQDTFKPTHGDVYFYIDTDGSIQDGYFENCLFEYNLYKIGNMYKTVKEAKANSDRWGNYYAAYVASEDGQGVY